MPPRRKAKKGVKRTEEDKKEIPRQEKKEDSVDEEAERQAAAIRAIRDVEIEHTLTALDLLCSYFTEEQIQTPVLGFFKDNLPDLSIARDEESGEIELKWNDSDGVDVNDSILKRLSMGFPDLYNNSRPSLGGYNNVGGSMLGTGNTHLQNLGTSASQMLASHDALRTPVAFSVHELPLLSHLNIRGNPLDQNSVGELFQVLKLFPSLSSLEVDIPGPLGNSAVEILESLPNLSLLNGVDTAKIFENGKHVVDSMIQPRLPEPRPEDSLIDRVLGAMWLYVMNYRLADEEKIDETSLWYVMDELGSALGHSDEPNFKVAPFLFMPSGNLDSAVSYSIMWPIKSCHKGDECTRDFLSGIGEDKHRSARLTAWFHTPEIYFIHEFEKYQQNQHVKAFKSLPLTPTISQSIRHNDGSPLLVHTDLPQVEEFLTRSEFVLTNEPKDADIIWTSMQVDEELKKAVGLTDDQYINQFPFEACLVMKHHLAETIQKAYGSPEWLQRTYNLETELTQFIGDYCVRKRDGLDNLWILKPWNMARTIDTSITDSLSAIIRMMETGPKICQKYIEHPALFKGKKFDLRYVVLLRSIDPLEIYLTDIFWVRLSNNPYSLEKHSFFEYETHFTVMNYGRKLNHKPTAEFVREFEQEHNVKWMDIHEKVKQVIRQVFEAAALVHPEMKSDKSRAMYGVDVMLDSSFQPKILEVTYCPDCMRACTYDMETINGKGIVKAKEFFNYVFGCLFLGETSHVTPL